jgi:orotate phosphoribosyltransferase
MSTTENQRALLDLMLEAEVLRFGTFTTKSGRETPYFINTGRYRTGSHIRRLGQLYARSILERLGTQDGLGVDVLFGPAYKGIPLVVATAAALSELGHDVGYCFNRKEAKTHGEGGQFVGQELSDGQRVLIVEDITTAGTAVREAAPLLRQQADVVLAGLVVSVDRRERRSDDDRQSALASLAEEFAMPTWSLLSIDDILQLADLPDATKAAIEAYLERYGAVSPA